MSIFNKKRRKTYGLSPRTQQVIEALWPIVLLGITIFALPLVVRTYRRKR